MHIHPLVKILYFVLVLMLVSVIGNAMLLPFMMFFIAMVFAFRTWAFFRAIRRMRWLFFSMLLIYAFGTPGELVPEFPASFAPTYEGVLLGAYQIEKLAIALAALSLLLTSSPREDMLLGLYMLVIPFKFLGFNVKRFAARLMLTLDYVEELAAKDKGSFSFSQLDAIDAHIDNLPQTSVVSFRPQPFSLVDKLLLFFLTALCVVMIYRGFA